MNYVVRICGVAGLCFLGGCVSTVSEPGQRQAMIGNAETDPRAMEVARQKAAQQRQEYNRQRESLAGASTLEQPLMMQGGVEQDAIHEREPMAITYADLAGLADGKKEVTQAAAAVPELTVTDLVSTEVSSGKLLTKGVPALSGVRLLGSVLTPGGRENYMMKQEGQVAEVLSVGKQLRVNDISYRVRGSGVDGVIVEDSQGQSFLVRR